MCAKLQNNCERIPLTGSETIVIWQEGRQDEPGSIAR